MQYMEHDLGQRQRGERVRVTLNGNAANVQLMDSSARGSYKRRGRYQYIGGHVTRSPVDLTIPRSGHWYVLVDLGGLPGRVRSSAQLLPGPLPRFRPQRTSLPVISSATGLDDAAVLRIEPPSAQRPWDVFVAHAAEDKDSLVRDLAAALMSRGLRVWYDENVLRLGDSLRRRIDEGLAKSRFGVVVVSHAFFAKNWPQYELDGLVTRESTGEQVILPIWHHIGKEEVVKYSPSLADKLAARTADATISEIAEEIANRVRA